MEINMNTIDFILLFLFCTFFLSQFFKKRRERPKYFFSESDVTLSEKQVENICPVFHIIFQKEVNDENLVSEIADMYLEGRTYYYNGKSYFNEGKTENIYIRYADVQWDKLQVINV